MALVAWRHQTKALTFLEQRGEYAALFMEMGTGKTRVIIDEFVEAINSSTLYNLLVIAPKGAYRNWPDELRKHMNEKLYQRCIIAIWKGKIDADIKAFINAVDRPRVLIMNVEAFSTVKNAINVAYTFLKRHPTIMVVDESTRIKDHKAKRTINIITLGKYAKRKRILSGLPTPNGPLDLYSQMEFLNSKILDFPSYVAFQRRYAVLRQVVTGRMLKGKWGGWYQEKFTVIDGYINEEELRDKIAPYCFRVTKAECLDLPPKIWEREVVELTPEQKRIYSELKAHATAELAEGHITATRVITRMIRLHQLVCGYAVDEEGNMREVKHNRLEQLMEILSDYKNKVVIWANYIYSINQIVERITKDYSPEAVARFDGTNSDTRNNEETRWKSDPKCRFMIATQQSGGLGNNWIEANLVIYYSNNYNLELRMQSEDRSHRGGQTKSVTYIDLVCPGTVDETIIGALRDKIDLDTVITGDNYRQWLI